MQLGAVSQQVPDLPMVVENRDLGWGLPEANVGSALALDPPGLNRWEVTGLALLSLVLHALLAVQVARKGRSAPVLHEQQVMIEILRPPVPPPVVQPEPPKPEPQPPIARKTEAHRPEPRVVAKLEPVAQPTKPSLANELPELPVGDDPALAMASGKGTGSAAAPRWPRTKERTILETHGPHTRNWRSGVDGKVRCCCACACRPMAALPRFRCRNRAVATCSIRRPSMPSAAGRSCPHAKAARQSPAG